MHIERGILLNGPLPIQIGRDISISPPHSPLPNPYEFELEVLEGQSGANTGDDDLYGASPPGPKSKLGSPSQGESSRKKKITSEEESTHPLQ